VGRLVAGLPKTSQRPYTHPQWIEGRTAVEIDESPIVQSRTRQQTFHSLKYVDDEAKEASDSGDNSE
jgi:hypothetical protein